MTQVAELSLHRGTLTVSVPLSIRSSGGGSRSSRPIAHRTGLHVRRRSTAQSSRPWPARSAGVGCWTTANHGTIADLAAAERISASYIGRVLRLTVLAPEVVDASLNPRSDSALGTAQVFRPFPVDWAGQYEAFGPI
jgi:hypothetical protein